MIRRGALLALALAAAAPALAADFTTAQRAAVLRHGPWPPPPVADASNRVDGDVRAIALGRSLFDDPRLSASGRLACASCHRPDAAFADGLKVAMAARPLARNTPSLWNVAFNRWFGWGGANDTLWGASIRPMLASDELAASPERLARVVADDPELARRYAGLFGEPEPATAVVNVGKALAAYQATLVTGRTPFDDFRDALASDDAKAMALYPKAARRGLAIFVGKGDCALCHGGPTFSNGEFEDVAIPYFIAPGRVDPGRHAGLAAFRASPYTRAGPHSDDPDGRAGRLTANVRAQHKDWGAFRAPSLRQVARTAPYMHNGSLATLRDVVRHYSEIDIERLHADGVAILRPLRLTDAEVDDLVAFLETLTDQRGR